MADPVIRKVGDVLEGRGGEKYVYIGGDPGNKDSYKPFKQTQNRAGIAEARVKADPTSGMSGMDLLLSGSGKRATDVLTLGGALPWLPRADAESNAKLMDTWPAILGGVATDLFPAVRMANVAARVPGILSLGANAGMAGLYDAAAQEGGVGDRAAAGLLGAVLTGGGEVATRAAGGLLGGPLAASRVTPEARELLDEGVPVPPWKATTSARLRDFGERAKVSFVGKQFMIEPELAAFRKWNQNLIEGATPPKPVFDGAGNILRWTKDTVKEVSDNSLNLLRGRFNESFDALYKGRAIPLDDAYNGQIKSVLEASDKYLPHLSQQIRGIASKVDDILSSTKSTEVVSPIVGSKGEAITNIKLGHAGATPGAIREALDAVDDAISGAYKSGNGEKAEALKGLADALHSARLRGLPPEVQSMASEINKSYTNFLQLQRAHTMKGAQKSGLVTPDQMLTALKALDSSPGKAAFARGNVPNQSVILNADRVLGNTLPTVGPGSAEKLVLAGIMGSPFALGGDLLTAAAAATLATPGGQRFLWGQIPGQGILGGAARASAPYVGQATGLLNQ